METGQYPLIKKQCLQSIHYLCSLNVAAYIYKRVLCLLMLYGPPDGTTSIISYYTYFTLSTLLYETIKNTMFGYVTDP